MCKFSDIIGCSEKYRRWMNLVYLAAKLHDEGEVDSDQLKEKMCEWEEELDQLVRDKEKNESTDDHESVLKENQKLIKSSESVLKENQKKKIESSATIGKISGPKTSFKIGCPKKPLSCKITAKNEALENPNSKGRKRKGSQLVGDQRSKSRTSVVTLPVPEEVKKHILDSRGTCLEGAVLVMEKKLSSSDVNPQQSRLSIPYGKIFGNKDKWAEREKRFLRPSEISESASESGMKVVLVEPCLDECNLVLKNWQTNTMYALNSGWNKVCKRNELKQEMGIQLWSFRRRSRLCFALVKVGLEDGSQGM